MTRVKGTLCFKTYTISMDWRERRLCLPIKKVESGHFHLQFFPMSEISTSLTISFKTNQQCVFNFTFSRSLVNLMYGRFLIFYEYQSKNKNQRNSA